MKSALLLLSTAALFAGCANHPKNAEKHWCPANLKNADIPDKEVRKEVSELHAGMTRNQVDQILGHKRPFLITLDGAEQIELYLVGDYSLWLSYDPLALGKTSGNDRLVDAPKMLRLQHRFRACADPK